MTKEKVRVQLEVWDSSVMFRVLYMDERFRAKKWRFCRTSYLCDNKIVIKSVYMPNLCTDTVYLQGHSRMYDVDSARLTFDTEEQAREYKAKVLEALADWAENWPGWAEDDEQPEVDNPPGEVYSF